jgi:hypothetical protein
MLDNYIRRILSAVLVMKSLPDKREDIDPSNYYKLEKGLTEFVRNKLKEVLQSFKRGGEVGS